MAEKARDKLGKKQGRQDKQVLGLASLNDLSRQ